MPINNKPYYLIMTKNTSLNLMGGSEIYTSPKCEVIDLAMDTAVCQTSNFGETGAPGNPLLEDDFGIF